jgi:hypothetical protein
MVFLSETKLLSADFSPITNTFGNRLSKHFFVDCNISDRNRSGGLAILWNNDVHLSINGYNERMIDCYVDCGDSLGCWRATGVYGYSKQHQKNLTCDLITNLANTNQHENWLLFGDLNLIFNSNEKQRGRDSNFNSLTMANNTIKACNLIDLGFQGSPFTWTNNQEGEHHIKERLDRFCATASWMAKFPRFTNYHLLNYNSDHCPILLVFGTLHDFRDNSHSKACIKRFENFWTQDDACAQIIKATWDHTTGDIQDRLHATMESTYQWGKATYGSVPKAIKETKDKIQSLKSLTPTREQLTLMHQLEAKLDDLLNKEEAWWAPRAKTKWLQLGDRNSKFFHFKASQRHRKNRINFIIDEQGICQSNNDKIQQVFMQNFTDLFTSSNPSDMQRTINVVANRVQPEQQAYLSQQFTAAEVAHATHQLKSSAAPGSDGLNAKFYQHYWDLLGSDITQTMLNILNNGGNPEPFNNTHICLIPKHKNPYIPADYRPIALCNVILKIITKTIANRVKEVLYEVVSPQQSAFLPGRLITDNTLIALETFHHLKNNKNKKKRYVGIKLDMAKAYDRLEWNFIKTTLITIGFPNSLVETIMRCVSSVSYSILVNGHPTPLFKPHMGIRQGDPLSPFLFILCVDVFSRMITNKQDQNLLNGIAIAQTAPKISHLFFADDSIIFCKANKAEANQLKEVFEEY